MLTMIIEIPLLRGLIMGVLLAAPIGAVGAMCVKRAMSGQWLRALAVGLGSATVDTLFGAIAAFGLTIIASYVLSHQTLLGLIGGVIVTGMGVATYMSQFKSDGTGDEAEQIGRDFAKAVTMSAANPATFLGALGLFAALGPTDPDITRLATTTLVAGVFCGSMLWWTFLSAIAHLFRRRFGPKTLQRFNKIEGVVIVVLGLAVIAVATFGGLGGNRP